jgi:hypothetical protein
LYEFVGWLYAFSAGLGLADPARVTGAGAVRAHGQRGAELAAGAVDLRARTLGIDHPLMTASRAAVQAVRADGDRGQRSALRP